MEQKTDYKKPEVLKRILYKAPGHAAKVMHVDAKYLCNLKHLVANADIIEHVPMIPAIVEGSPIQICVDEDGVAVFAKFKPFNPYEDNYDYQIGSLSDTEIKLINEFLNDGNQAIFEREFKNKYPNMKSYLTPVVRKII